MRIAVFIVLVFCSACLSFQPLSAKIAPKLQPVYQGLAARAPGVDLLILALDGVPYEMIEGLKTNGAFPGFSAPSRVVSTFPSSTMPGFTGLFLPLGGDLPPGYEAKFFSLSENRFHGSSPQEYHRFLIPFKQFFNYYRYSLLNKTAMYAFPGASVARDLERIRKTLLFGKMAGAPGLMAYIGGTDGAGHVLGRHRVEHLVKSVSEAIVRLRRDYAKIHGRALEIVLYSDHGFRFGKLHHITTLRTAKALAAHDFRFSKHLERRRDAVSVTFGSLSASVFYTAPEDADALADVVSRIEGFDLVFSKGQRVGDIERYGVYSHSGAWAEIEVKDRGQFLRYIPRRGDPLHYLPLLSRLNPDEQGSGGEAPWLSQSRWWNLSQGAEYPDALSRVYDGFENLVQNSATVLASTLPDFEYGSALSRFGANLHGGLEGTHGGLFDSASNAFVMTTFSEPLFPPIVSYRDLFPILMNRR